MSSWPAFVGGSAAQRDSRLSLGWWAVGAAKMVHGEYCGSVLVDGGGTPRSLRFLRVCGLLVLSDEGLSMSLRAMGAREVRVEVGQRPRDAHPGRLIGDGGASCSSGWPLLRLVR